MGADPSAMQYSTRVNECAVRAQNCSQPTTHDHVIGLGSALTTSRDGYDTQAVTTVQLNWSKTTSDNIDNPSETKERRRLGRLYFVCNYLYGVSA